MTRNEKKIKEEQKGQKKTKRREKK